MSALPSLKPGPHSTRCVDCDKLDRVEKMKKNPVGAGSRCPSCHSKFLQKETGEIRIIFDNGGGITLQLGDYFAHWYQDAKQAAEDLKVFLADQDTSSWDGHEEDSLYLDPTEYQISNGQYRVFDSIKELMESDQEWGNIKTLQTGLAHI